MSFKIDRFANSFAKTGRLMLPPCPCSVDITAAGNLRVSSDISALGKGPSDGTAAAASFPCAC